VLQWTVWFPLKLAQGALCVTGAAAPVPVDVKLIEGVNHIGIVSAPQAVARGAPHRRRSDPAAAARICYHRGCAAVIGADADRALPTEIGDTGR
jgi:hypothetical protein